MFFRHPHAQPSALRPDERIMRHVEAVIGRARRESALRFIALDESERPSRTLMTLSGTPRAFDPATAAGVAEWVDGCAEVVTIAQLVGVWQRPGSAQFGANDLAWVRLLDRALRDAGYPVRAWLLSHSRGLRWIAWDDLLPERVTI